MMMIPARRNGNGLDIFDEVFTDPFFGEKENKIMKTDLKEKDGKYMIVGRGLGTHSINIRFCNRPQLLVVRLLPKQDEPEEDR